jgi:hypothetical protein
MIVANVQAVVPTESSPLVAATPPNAISFACPVMSHGDQGGSLFAFLLAPVFLVLNLPPVPGLGLVAIRLADRASKR